MNKIIILITSFIIILSNQIKAQNNGVFTLICQFKDLPDGTKMYLTTQERDTVAKTISNGDHFIFKGTLPLNGRFHFIRIDTLVSKVATKAIFLENKKIYVYGVVGTDELTVIGSQGQLDYNQFLEKLSKIAGPDEKLKFKKAWLLNHRQSLSTPWFVKSLKSLEDKQAAYNTLSAAVKASYYGVELKNDLGRTRLRQKVKEGSIMPNFSINDLEGRQIDILDIFAKNKFTLIDFWASWCSPCRAEIPNLKKIFTKYKNKGFNILGISSDANQVAWRKALMEDETPWIHGIQSEKNVSKLFGISSIPSYILVDSKGKLIAFDSSMSSVPSFGPEIRGEGLYKTLESLINGNK